MLIPGTVRAELRHFNYILRAGHTQLGDARDEERRSRTFALKGYIYTYRESAGREGGGGEEALPHKTTAKIYLSVRCEVAVVVRGYLDVPPARERGRITAARMSSARPITFPRCGNMYFARPPDLHILSLSLLSNPPLSRCRRVQCGDSRGLGCMS